MTKQFLCTHTHEANAELFEKGQVYVFEVSEGIDSFTYSYGHSGGGTILDAGKVADCFKEVIVFRMLQATADYPDIGVEEGQVFRIVQENEHGYEIIVPQEQADSSYEDTNLVFTKQPDFEGYSYKNWFTLVERMVPAEG